MEMLNAVLPALARTWRQSRRGAVKRRARRAVPVAETLEGRALLAAPSYGYALDLGGPNNSETYGVATDAAGNTVVTGFFIGTIHLDPNNPSNPAGTLNMASGYYDSSGDLHRTPSAYVARYDASGNLLWAHGMGWAGGDPASAAAAGGDKVAVDGSGNIYAIGEISGSINFGNDASGSPVILTGPPYGGGPDSEYLVKYAPDGTVQWGQTLVNASSGFKKLAVDPQGDVFLVNRFGGTAVVGNRTLSYTNGTHYVAKFASDGTFGWVDQFNVLGLPDIAADSSGNALITGDFIGTVDFDPGSGTYNLSGGGVGNNPNQAAFVAKLDASGGLDWAVAFQGSGKGRFGGTSSAGVGIAVDASGNVYSTGVWGGSVDFDPAGGKTTYYLPAGSGGRYVSKLSSTGQFIWAKAFGGSPTSMAVAGIAVDPSGNVDLVGDFAGTANFDPNGTHTLTSASNAVFVLQLSSSGRFNWVVDAGGTGTSAATGIAVDPYGDIFTTGIIDGAVTFDPNGDATLVAQAPLQDGFLWELKPTP